MEYLTPNYHALYDFDDYVSRLATEEQYYAFKRSMENGGYLQGYYTQGGLRLSVSVWKLSAGQ